MAIVITITSKSQKGLLSEKKYRYWLYKKEYELYIHILCIYILIVNKAYGKYLFQNLVDLPARYFVNMSAKILLKFSNF